MTDKDLIDRLAEALGDEMQRRHAATFVDEWVNNERQALVDAANDWAKLHDIERRITVDDVAVVEQRAIGHVDYHSKMALYVAELVEGTR